jgi:hypothetical protein
MIFVIPAITTEIITRQSITVRHVRRFVTYQEKDGHFTVNDNTCSFYGFESQQQCIETLKKSFGSKDVAKLDSNIFITAITLYYWRFVAVDHQKEWYQQYDKAEAWLIAQLNDEKLVEQVHACARKLVIDRYKVDRESIHADESFANARKNKVVIEQKVKESTRSAESEVKVVRSTDTVVIGTLRIKLDRARNVLNAAGWLTTNDPYICILDANSKEIVRTKTAHSTCDPVFEEVHYVAVHYQGEKFTFEMLDSNLFTDDTPLGSYVLDTADLVVAKGDCSYDTGKILDKWEKLQLPDGKGTKGELHIEARFYPRLAIADDYSFTREQADVRYLYALLSWRLTSGCFKLSDSLARYFNFKTQDELVTSFKRYVVSDNELRSLDLSVWSTALTISYLRIVYWKFQGEWNMALQDSEKWVSSQVYDVDVEDRLYEVTRKFIIDKFGIKEFSEEQQIVGQTKGS